MKNALVCMHESMGTLTPESGAAPTRCAHRWQQHAVVSTAHCHRRSRRHRHPAGTAPSPQSHQCSTRRASTQTEMYTERLVLFSMITQGNDYIESCIRQRLHARPGLLLCKHPAFQEGEQRLPILQRLLCAHK